MVRIGLIGYGFMGKMHAECYKASGKAKVVAVADIEEDRRAEASSKLSCKAFESIDALLQGSDVDAIDVCTPTYMHEEHVLKALDAGKDVFCEKPLSLSMVSCERMVSAAKASGSKLMIGHVVRFWPECQVLKSILDSGRLGRPLWATAQRLSAPATWAWQGWLADPVRSGGAILDLHIHDLDFLVWVLGRPKQVVAYGIKTAKGAYDSALTMLIGHENGMSSQAVGCLAMPEGFPFTSQIRVVCEKGVIFFDATASPSLILQPEGEPEEYPQVPQPTAGSADAGGNVSSLGGYYNEIVYFLDCIEKGLMPQIITPEEAAYAVRLCLAARQSAETGQAVSV
ncbi:MAG: Gfo/Idh/MocA family oxidoreductase [Armatimonadetes bacterium]|nr:Gfo/Idh/MocA family oxidoreductase [Armatimonadota bacterium]